MLCIGTAAHPKDDQTVVLGTAVHAQSTRRHSLETLGHMPHEYIHTLRLEEAKQMLESTDDPIDQVALGVAGGHHLAVEAFGHQHRHRTVGVVLAAGGYPGDYAKGAAINGLDAAASLEGKVFHAGTALKDGNVVTAGGRVLCATAMGASVGEGMYLAARSSGLQFK